MSTKTSALTTTFTYTHKQYLLIIFFIKMLLHIQSTVL